MGVVSLIGYIGCKSLKQNIWQSIIYYLKNDISQKEVSKIFNINERTFRRWLEKYNNDEIDRPERGTKSYKVKKKHVEYVLKLLKKTQLGQ